jgi:hypothetical protein
LVGQTVDVSYLYPDQATVFQDLGSGTVTAPGFTVNSFGLTNYTVTGSQIIVTDALTQPVYFLFASFNGIEVSETGGSPVTITGATIDSTSNLAGFVPSDISFDASDVWLNLEDLTTQPGQQLVVDLTFGNTAVPEPGSIVLSLIGVGLLFTMRKRIGQGLLQTN